MKNSTIRSVVILAVLCIAGISIIQVYWFRRAFDLRKDEFDRTVTTALFNVAQQLFEINNTPSPANNPVRQVSTNYFAVMVNSELKADLLEFLLRTEFEKSNIQTDFEYGIYDCASEQMVYCNYVSLQSSSKRAATFTLPKWSSLGYYFGVKFPYREAHILNQMGIWTFSSVVLLLVIVFFCYALFVILKQKRLSEIQKDFINNMTHEFKTPLSTIAVSAEAIRDPIIHQHPERLLNYTSIIQKENSRLTQQVERVLQMARIDKGSIILKKESVSIQQVVHEAIQQASAYLEQKQGVISCDFNATNDYLQADKLHLTNALFNLLDNAIKYCATAPKITIVTRDHKNGIVLEAHDNGIGIGKEESKRVFEKFYRVPTGNVHDVKGFGLGLSYVKNIVEAHKGKISLRSAPQQGSVFTIFLPE